MDVQEIQAILDAIDTQMLQLNDTVVQLRRTIDTLVEDNNRLRMRNNDLSQLLREQGNYQSTSDSDHLVESDKGLNRLLEFYHEGIHICHQYFGSSRSTQEECIFCQGVLDSLEQ